MSTLWLLLRPASVMFQALVPLLTTGATSCPQDESTQCGHLTGPGDLVDKSLGALASRAPGLGSSQEPDFSTQKLGGSPQPVSLGTLMGLGHYEQEGSQDTACMCVCVCVKYQAPAYQTPPVFKGGISGCWVDT